MCKVYTGCCGTSEIEHGLCSLKLGDYLSIQAHKPCSISHLIYITFINTDSLNFSLLTILMATLFPVTQCTPSFTRPAKKALKPHYNIYLAAIMAVLLLKLHCCTHLAPCVRPCCVCSVLRAHAQFCRFDKADATADVQ